MFLVMAVLLLLVVVPPIPHGDSPTRGLGDRCETAPAPETVDRRGGGARRGRRRTPTRVGRVRVVRKVRQVGHGRFRSA